MDGAAQSKSGWVGTLELCFVEDTMAQAAWLGGGRYFCQGLVQRIDVKSESVRLDYIKAPLCHGMSWLLSQSAHSRVNLQMLNSTEAFRPVFPESIINQAIQVRTG